MLKNNSIEAVELRNYIDTSNDPRSKFKDIREGLGWSSSQLHDKLRGKSSLTLPQMISISKALNDSLKNVFPHQINQNTTTMEDYRFNLNEVPTIISNCLIVDILPLKEAIEYLMKQNWVLSSNYSCWESEYQGLINKLQAGKDILVSTQLHSVNTLEAEQRYYLRLELIEKLINCIKKFINEAKLANTQLAMADKS